MAKKQGDGKTDEPKIFNRLEEYPGFTKASSEFGGGMSAAEQRLQNHAGRIPYDVGPAEVASGGKNLGRDATNVLSKPGTNPPEASPTSKRQSRDQ